MNTIIKCPHCGSTLDDNILSQLTDHKTELAIQRALQQKNDELKLREQELQATYKTQLEQERSLAIANARLTTTEELNKSQLDIERLKREIDEERKRRQQEMETWANQQKAIIREKELEKENEKQEALAKTQLELEKLKEKLEQINELHQKDQQNLKLELERQEQEKILKLTQSKEQQTEQIKQDFIKEKTALEYELQRKTEQLEQEKNFKSKLSVKLRGEDLEQHCQLEFDLHRAQFPYAEFFKDNKVVDGAKGDFVYRDFTDATKQVEILSIMFEMKNQNRDSVTKQTNKQFLDKLDKDRLRKKCEYAVLVTMLEEDNPLYDSGIVKSYDYEKMYIIRPVHFITLINMLKDVALNLSHQKQELMVIKNQNIELVELEKRLDEFKEGFNRNYNLADTQFNKAITEIDKSIEALEKTKQQLLSSTKNLGLASKKTEGLDIKKLTKKLPKVQEILEEQKLQQAHANMPTSDNPSEWI
ncbi:MAG: DUF2130 domain-containing protein [Firmicutes bacterium]|nr:DUF2130 domain-containing protein [Bacillota bacterium]MCL1954102.1 DUF2130 domain-containing protein [Bacillota bacterium]